jgi:hypothetical protein
MRQPKQHRGTAASDLVSKAPPHQTHKLLNRRLLGRVKSVDLLGSELEDLDEHSLIR